MYIYQDQNVMKTYKFLIMIVAVQLVVCACNDDPETPDIQQSGIFTIEGVEYTLAHGEILRFEPAHGVYGCPLYFLSDDYEFSDNHITGIGQTAEGFIWSDTDVYLKSGTYSVLDENNPQSTTFFLSFFHNWNVETWHMDFIYQCKDGTLEVSRNGDIYDLFFDVLTDKYEMESTMTPKETPIDTDIRITLSYSGTLEQKYFE